MNQETAPRESPVVKPAASCPRELGDSPALATELSSFTMVGSCLQQILLKHSICITGFRQLKAHDRHKNPGLPNLDAHNGNRVHREDASRQALKRSSLCLKLDQILNFILT